MNKDFVYKRRLLALADLLWNLPKKRFNYASWVGSNWRGKPDLSCGTTACAFGWATTMPSLRRLGLHLSDIGSGEMPAYEVRLNTGTRSLDTAEAANEVFGLDYDEYLYLFIPGHSAHIYVPGDKMLSDKATAKQVAKHIRRFVEHKYSKGYNE